MLNRRRIFTFTILSIVAGISALDHAGAFIARPDRNKSHHLRTATITYAADGDTIDINIPDHGRPTTRVRLWGIDCPETAHAPGESDAHFGPQATDFVRSNLVGKQVRVILDPNRSSRDRYGRLLAYLQLTSTGDDLATSQPAVNDLPPDLVNALLITKGFAYADRRFPNLYQKDFIKLEDQARSSKTGLWESVRTDQMPGWRRRIP